MRHLIQYIVCLMCLLCCGSRNSCAALKDAEEFYLNNGMQVVVIPNHKAPIIRHIVLYKVGSVNDPQGKGGLAHLTEHLMFRGTRKVKDGRLNRLLEINGAESNAGTTRDYTYYHQFLSLDKLELAMYLEADRMTGLDFTEDAFQKERDIVYQEREQRMNSNPASGFWEKFDRFFFGDNPYGRPIGGTKAEIKNISKADVISFYKKYYTPNNAVLILSGDIDVATARDLAQKYYGTIKSAADSSSMEKTIENLIEQQKNGVSISAQIENVSVNRLVGQYLLPRFSGDSKEIPAFELYASWLGDGVNSLLYRELVEKQKLVESVGADFSYLSGGNSLFYVYAYAKKENDIPKIKQAFNNIIRKSEKMLTAAKLAELKEKSLAGMVYLNDNPSDMADIMVQWLGAGYHLTDLKELETRVSQVTLAEMKAVIKSLSEIMPVWGVVSPKGGADVH